MDLKFDTDAKDNATNQQRDNYMISQSPRSLNDKVTLFFKHRSMILSVALSINFKVIWSSIVVFEME